MERRRRRRVLRRQAEAGGKELRDAAVEEWCATRGPESAALVLGIRAETISRAIDAVSALILAALAPGREVLLRLDGSIANDRREYLSAAEVARGIAAAADLWDNPSAPPADRIPSAEAARLARWMPIAAGQHPRFFPSVRIVRLTTDDGFLMEAAPPADRVADPFARWFL